MKFQKYLGQVTGTIACIFGTWVSASDNLRVSHEDITNGQVMIVGRLGVPLGTVVKVAAKVEAVTDYFGVVNAYRLAVYRVDGLELETVASFDFSNWGEARVASTPSQLGELVRKLQIPNSFVQRSPPDFLSTFAPSISAAEAESFREGYIGSTHILFAYEIGEFVGSPRTVPPEVSEFAPPQEFRFVTSLVVLGSTFEAATKVSQ